MKHSINYLEQYTTVLEEALSYSDMTDEQIIDAITEVEGANWFDSTDQYDRYPETVTQ